MFSQGFQTKGESNTIENKKVPIFVEQRVKKTCMQDIIDVYLSFTKVLRVIGLSANGPNPGALMISVH